MKLTNKFKSNKGGDIHWDILRWNDESMIASSRWSLPSEFKFIRYKYRTPGVNETSFFFLEDFKIEILIENRNPIFPANFFVSATPLCCQAFVLSHDPASKHYTRLCFRSNASAAIHFRVQSAVNYRTKRDLIYWFFRVVHVGLVDYRACERTVSLVLLYNEGMNLVFLLVILFF